MQATRTAWYAGVSEWRGSTQETPWEQLQAQYLERYLLSRGELFVDAWRSNPYKNDPRVYKNISLLWDVTSRVVDFYSIIVYQGQLSTTPGEGAIPIRLPETMPDAEQQRLMTAIGVLYRKWNWQRKMRVRPRLGASLGDVLTELVDSTERRFVYPRIVWPGYVKTIELDHADNVTAYTLEYQITEKDERGNTETYTFRKEVDREAFRYFKDDKPFDYFGDGAVVPNVYGFVPAIWDRHITDDLSVRGSAATDVSRQSLFGLNSLFSHARDFQHKAFLAPVIVSGRLSDETQVELFPGSTGSDEDASALARQLHYLEGDENVRIAQAQFDLGDTLAMLEKIEQNIYTKHPEAQFFDRLADAQNVTGPGADRIILPVKGLVESARDGYDPNTVHLLQMAISMCGMRVNSDSKDWEYLPNGNGTMRRVQLDDSRKAFAPYTLASYDAGAMEFTIGARDIIIPSRAEQIEMAMGVESLKTLYGLRMAQVPEKEAQAIIDAQNERYAMTLNRGDFGADYEG